MARENTKSLDRPAVSELSSSNLLGNMPCESGYYWIFFEGLTSPDLGYLYADDMDVGSRRVRFITGKEIRDGDSFFENSRWFKIPKPYLPNTKISGRESDRHTFTTQQGSPDPMR